MIKYMLEVSALVLLLLLGVGMTSCRVEQKRENPQNILKEKKKSLRRKAGFPNMKRF